jgi:hypothetical protein
MSLYYLLRSNDIEAATSAKSRVEQKQRDEAKTRKDENTAWANKVNIECFIRLNIVFGSFVFQIYSELFVDFRTIVIIFFFFAVLQEYW